jgi:hypothetical protein
VKHHYVPAFYLRAFVDPGCPPDYEPYLWVVDLDKRMIRRQSPDNTAALTDYHAVGDGDDRYDAEKYQREALGSASRRNVAAGTCEAREDDTPRAGQDRAWR